MSSSSGYLIAIGDEYKLVWNGLPYNAFYNMVKKVYPTCEVTPLTTSHSTEVLKTYRKPDSFIDCGALDSSEFLKMVKQYDDTMEYFTKLKAPQKVKDSCNTDSNFLKACSVRNVAPSSLTKNEETNSEQSSELLPYLLVGKRNVPAYKLNVNMFESFDDKVYITDTYDLYANPIFRCYYNTHYDTILMLPQDNDIPSTYLKNIFPELEFIAEYALSTTQYTTIEPLLKEYFLNIDDAKTQINSCIRNDSPVINYKISSSELKRLVERCFSFTTKVEDRLQFTAIYDSFLKNYTVSSEYETYVKRMLSVVLEDIGLEKKRYREGIYWYGIIPNEKGSPINSDIPSIQHLNRKPEQGMTDKTMKEALDEYVRLRSVDDILRTQPQSS